MKNRDLVALELAKTFLAAQLAHRRMTLIGRLKWYLGFEGVKQNFDTNFKDIANKSYEMADTLIEAGLGENNTE